MNEESFCSLGIKHLSSKIVCHATLCLGTNASFGYPGSSEDMPLKPTWLIGFMMDTWLAVSKIQPINVHTCIYLYVCIYICTYTCNVYCKQRFLVISSFHEALLASTIQEKSYIMPRLCGWGDIEQVKVALQRCRGSMTNLMDLDELVEFDGEETQEFKHMRIQQLFFWFAFSRF